MARAIERVQGDWFDRIVIRQQILRVSLPFYGWQLTAARSISGYPQEIRHLGDHIRRRRMDLGLTRKETAKMLGTNGWSL